MPYYGGQINKDFWIFGVNIQYVGSTSAKCAGNWSIFSKSIIDKASESIIDYKSIFIS